MGLEGYDLPVRFVVNSIVLEESWNAGSERYGP